MENNNPSNPNSSQNNDATRIISSDNVAGDKNQASNQGNDATRIETNTAENKAGNTNTVGNTAANASNPINPNPATSIPNNNKSSGVSSGAFAAGVAGAAVAGVAAGAVFSDEIKDVANNLSDSASSTLNDGEPVTETTANVANPDSILDISSTDQAGNTYSVSFIDANHDGTIDAYTGTIENVDGTSISYSGQGNPFEIGAEPPLASIEDFTNHQPDIICYGPPTDSFDSFENDVYHIQSGDTLSEIALEHGTSVEEIMAINPDIQDPNLIYAGNDLNLPEGSVFPDFNSPQEMPNADGLAEVSLEDISLPDGEMDQIDWDNFENPQYAEQLTETGFDDFSMPDSYEENGSMEFDNDTTSSDFLG
jgi:LysM repeat protein